jgi:hypothetical protein
MDLDQTWYILSPYESLEPIDFQGDSPKDYVCTKFGQNPLKDLDSREFTRMLCGENLTR